MLEARKINPTAAGYPLPQHPAGRPYSIPQAERRRRKVQLLLILATCLMLALVVVAQYSHLVILNYRISGARSDLKVMQEQVRVLELEAASLGSLHRVEQFARDELGMVDPEIGQLRVLSASRGE